jgi:hypothetical protein
LTRTVSLEGHGQNSNLKQGASDSCLLSQTTWEDKIQKITALGQHREKIVSKTTCQWTKAVHGSECLLSQQQV